ncbi:hypothetical protein WOLCODRAFT_164441 [Wolfiporia cocos MD-104 SS10]|uniref:Phospholipid/glycerol acyltransferase domain-containing protein n=1 Tax=Wolfiporia cocos (strain MD-104) TaxID=742152 RepID=A0A2H3JMM6_WOLCO|nr:hypothetical protein WOLCODRAFT_164441 [Wolfiporia cocos MD-104 SS10]
MPPGSPTPWSYFFIRLLFKFVLKIFYGTIVVENAHLIPPRGQPCIVCANHSNSLTDALLLVTAIPSKKRNLLRLTAKSTQFGKKTLTSWLIESAGTVPIKRRKDFPDGQADNTTVMLKLIELECPQYSSGSERTRRSSPSVHPSCLRYVVRDEVSPLRNTDLRALRQLVASTYPQVVQGVPRV